MSLKLQEEYGDDLQVLFVESQGTKQSAMASFALGKKWLGGNAMWTTESPFRLSTQGLPKFALLSSEGEIVLEGYTTMRKSDIDDTVEELVKARRKGPRDLPRNLAKALSEANQGNYAKAMELAEKAVADAVDDDHELAQAKEIQAEIERRVKAELERAAWLLENGYPLEGKELIETLRKGLKGLADYESQAEGLSRRLETPEMKLELEAGKQLARIEKKLYSSGPDAKYVKSLRKLVERYPGTKIGERASELAKIAAI